MGNQSERCEHGNFRVCSWCAMESIEKKVALTWVRTPPKSPEPMDSLEARVYEGKCRNGHKRTEETAYIRKAYDGRHHIGCRTCERERRKERYRRTGK